MLGSVLFKSKKGFEDVPEGLVDGKRWVFFDMDGTLVDLEGLNYALYREVIGKMYGLELLEDEWKKRFAGRRPQDSIPDYLRKKGIDGEIFDIDRFVAFAKPIKEVIIYNKLFDNSRLVKGAKEFLIELKQKGHRLILVTSTIRVFAESILKQYGIKYLFERLITGEEVEKGKPDPQVYLLAIKKSKATPEESVAFEDSKSGVKAALAAGLDCVLISTTRW